MNVSVSDAAGLLGEITHAHLLARVHSRSPLFQRESESQRESGREGGRERGKEKERGRKRETLRTDRIQLGIETSGPSRTGAGNL